MRSIESIQEAARDAALKAFVQKKEPVCLGSGQFHPPFPIPYIGTLVDQFSLPFDEIETFFVDSSGFGEPGEAAMTIEEFSLAASALVATFGAPVYWGVVQAGQFQVYVRAYAKGKTFPLLAREDNVGGRLQ